MTTALIAFSCSERPHSSSTPWGSHKLYGGTKAKVTFFGPKGCPINEVSLCFSGLYVFCVGT